MRHILKTRFFFFLLIGWLFSTTWLLNKFIRQEEISRRMETGQTVILVFYKEGCPYCKAGIPYVKSVSKRQTIPVFFIDTQSKMGKKYVQEYQVKYAATLLKIRKNQVIQKDIYTKSQISERGKKEYLPAKEKIERLFEKGEVVK